MELRAKERQSLWNISVQYLGSAEGVFALAARNGLAVTDRLTDGQRLEWETEDIVAASVANTYGVRGIVPATDISDSDYQELLAATSPKAAAAIAAVQPASEEETVTVERIEQVIKDLQEGKEPGSASGQALTRIFEDAFDTVFA